MSSPRIAILCGGPFAFPAINILSLEKYLAGIAIGSRDLQAISILASECERLEMPFEEIGSKSEMHLLSAWLEKVNPDYIFSICFPHKIPAEILEQKPGKFINFHTGPLPSYRGPMPIFEVLRNGEKKSAVSVHLMDAGYDTGAVIYEETVPVSTDENFASLAVKLSDRTSITALNIAQMLEFGTHIPLSVQDNSVARFYSYPTEKDYTIDWNSMTAERIISLVNACFPWCHGAITTFEDTEIRISAVHPIPAPSSRPAKPGTIIRKTGEGLLEIACFGGKSIEAIAFGSQDPAENLAFLDKSGLSEGKKLGA